MRYGKDDWAKPLRGAFGRLTSLAEDTPEHVVYGMVRAYGSESAHAVWKFLRELPEKLGADGPEELTLGVKPVGPLQTPAKEALQQWDGRLHSLFEMALGIGNVKPGDGSSVKFRADLIRMVYDELDPWLTPRIEFWFKETGVEERG